MFSLQSQLESPQLGHIDSQMVIRIKVYFPSFLWNTRVGWKVHWLTMMQWSNLTKCVLFFNIVSPVVHTVLPSVLQRLDSCDIGALILILKKSSTADMTSSVQCCFPAKWSVFMLGNRKKSDGAKSGEYGGWSTSSKPQSCNAAIATTDLYMYVQEHYPGETGFQGSEHCNTDGRNVWIAGESMLKNKPHSVKFDPLGGGGGGGVLA